MIEDWELDFHNPPRIPPRSPEMVQCRHCVKNIALAKAKKHDYFDGKVWRTAYFCSDEHMHAWYIQRLNTLGM